MRTRNVLAVASLTVAATGLGAALASAAVSPGAGVVLCFPGSGAIVRTVKTACPRGYSRVVVADQATAVRLTTQVNRLTTFLVSRYPGAVAVEHCKTGNSYVTWSGADLYPGSQVLLTLRRTDAAGVSTSKQYPATVPNGGSTPQTMTPWIQSGDTGGSGEITGTNLAGTVLRKTFTRAC